MTLPGPGSPTVVPQGKQEKVTLETKLSKYQVPRVVPSATNTILIKEMISFTRSGQKGAGEPGSLRCVRLALHFLPRSEHWRSVSVVISVTCVPCARHCAVWEADTTEQGFPKVRLLLQREPATKAPSRHEVSTGK